MNPNITDEMIDSGHVVGEPKITTKKRQYLKEFHAPEEIYKANEGMLVCYYKMLRNGERELLQEARRIYREDPSVEEYSCHISLLGCVIGHRRDDLLNVGLLKPKKAPAKKKPPEVVRTGPLSLIQTKEAFVKMTLSQFRKDGVKLSPMLMQNKALTMWEKLAPCEQEAYRSTLPPPRKVIKKKK